MTNHKSRPDLSGALFIERSGIKKAGTEGGNVRQKNRNITRLS
jgi:hypothetical protein